MGYVDGQIAEIQLDPSGGLTAWVQCPESAIPPAGRYLAAWSLEDPDAPLAVPLFLQQRGSGGFLTAPSLPASFRPGCALRLRGPLGTGFDLQRIAGRPGTQRSAVRRLALAALDASAARLLPLLDLALEQGAAVSLFCDGSLPAIPTAVEIYPTGELAEGLRWADFLALDLPALRLPGLRELLGLSNDEHLPCPAQALVLPPAMPCMGVGACGVCAVPARRGVKLACSQGPVFDLHELDW